MRLGVPEEHLFHLAGMDFPDWETPADALEYSAVKLFLQSARRARPGFELAGDDLRYVARICRLVGGMPLGILLAAAWLEMLTPAEIAAEMQGGLDFLATDVQGVPERQRSIRAVLDYSWNALTGREQGIFRELSVFRGGFTREAAQQVTGASLRDLMDLVNKSLLTRPPAGRYDIHELLRQYAAQRLAEIPDRQPAVEDRHCAYYAEFLCQREARLFGKDQRAVMSEIEAEIDNIRVGWEWAVAWHRAEEMERYLDSLAEFYVIRGWFREGVQVFGKAARQLADDKQETSGRDARMILARAQARLGQSYGYLGMNRKAEELLRNSLAVFHELEARRETAYALCYLAHGEGKEALSQYQDALEIFKAMGDRQGMALAVEGLGRILTDAARYQEAKRSYQDSLAMFRELGNQDGIASSLDGLGYVYWLLGDYGQARQLHLESLELGKCIGSPGGIARSLNRLGIDEIALREFEQAGQLWRESLAIFRDIGIQERTAAVLGNLAELADVQGNYAEAIQVAQEGLALHREIGHRFGIAWCCRVLGNAACGLGEFQQARSYYHRALLAVEGSMQGLHLHTLVGVATLLVAEQASARALELLALVFSHPASWQWAKDLAAPLKAQLEARLPPEVVAAAEARGRSRDLEATIQELLVELRD